MTASFGPRTFLVGQLIPAVMAAHPSMPEDEQIATAIRMADETLEKMQWPDGRPDSHLAPSPPPA